jgi:hypothetical protein
MSLFAHGRARRRLSLLAYEALDAHEREDTLRHVEACPRCARDLAEFRDLRARLDLDPARGAEPPVPVEFLATRVQARIDDVLKRPRPVWGRWLVPLAGTAAAVLALAALLPRLLPPLPAPRAAEAPEVSADALRHLERTVAREQTARYLSDAGDVLVSVAAASEDCDKREGRVEVGEASARSRDLLVRRALLVESDRAEVASAAPVLDDVEHALREVAALPSCVRAVEVQRVREQVEKRQLLMKIRLMRRELEG